MSILAQAKKMEARKGSFNIIMGEAGSGKTTFSGSYPKPMLYVKLADDGGEKVLEGIEGIDVIQLTTDSEYFKTKGQQGQRLADKLRSLILELLGEHEYKTVVIDPFTELATDMEQTMIKLKGGRALSFDDRSTIQNIIHPLFKGLQMLSEKIHVVLPCHVKPFENTDTLSEETYTKIMPSFTQSTAKELCKYADMILYISIRGEGGENELSLKGTSYKRVGIIGANPLLPTKLRLPQGKSADGKILENLSYTGLQAFIQAL